MTYSLSLSLSSVPGQRDRCPSVHQKESREKTEVDESLSNKQGSSEEISLTSRMFRLLLLLLLLRKQGPETTFRDLFLHREQKGSTLIVCSTDATQRITGRFKMLLSNICSQESLWTLRDFLET